MVQTVPRRRPQILVSWYTVKKAVTATYRMELGRVSEALGQMGAMHVAASTPGCVFWVYSFNGLWAKNEMMMTYFWGSKLLDEELLLKMRH